MSRWIEAHQSKQMASAREKLTSAVDSLLNVESMSDAAIIEAARLKKVHSYLEEMFSTIDPEIVGFDVWGQIRSYLEQVASYIRSYNLNRADDQVFHANNMMDAAVSQLATYYAARGKAGSALQAAALSQSKSIEEAVRNIKSAAASVAFFQKSLADQSADMEALAEEIRSKHKAVLGDGGDGGAAGEVEQKTKEIRAYHSELLNGVEGQSSIKDQIAQAKGEVLAQKDQINKDQHHIGSLRQAIEEFNASIYGFSVEDVEISGGLNNEFKLLLSAMKEFEGAQRTKYAALNEQIESLLPGATSAGLASAYKQMKDSFDDPIKNSSRLFYGSVALLVLVSFLLSVEQLWFLGVKFVAVGDWKSVLIGLVHKLPYYAPVLWLAFYATKRRSEYQRLQQEYAHKEALAKSYDSYKKQISDLGADGSSMLAALIERAVDAVAHNASSTLDGKHGDDMPIQKALEKVAEILKDTQKITEHFNGKGN